MWERGTKRAQISGIKEERRDVALAGTSRKLSGYGAKAQVQTEITQTKNECKTTYMSLGM